MLKLYPFQEKCIDELRAGFAAGHVRPILAAATGSGKTVMVSHMIRAAALKGNRSLFVVDRIVLVEQAAKHLYGLGLKVGVMQAENTWLQPDDEVIVASIQTLARRKPPNDVRLMVVDETHLLYRHHIQLFEAWDLVSVVGLSATPLREDLGKYFTNLVRGPTPVELMGLGYLVKPTVFCPAAEQMAELLSDVGVDYMRGDYVSSQLSTKLNRKELIGDLIATWQEKANELKTIVFCVDVAHSKAVCDDFLAAGVTAEQLDYRTSKGAREEIIGRFRDGSTTVLTSVNVLGIGFDVPDVGCGIMARPTLSEALFIQQAGRILRTAPGKDKAILLDHAGNTLRFGLPQDFIVPELGNGEHKSGSKRQKADHLTTCAECNAVMEVGQRVCPACGIEKPTKAADVHYIDGSLSEYGTGRTSAGASETEKRSWYLGLTWYAGRKGYKTGWAHHKYVEKFTEKPPFEWRDLEPTPPTGEMARWIKSRAIAFAKARKKHDARAA